MSNKSPLVVVSIVVTSTCIPDARACVCVCVCVRSVSPTSLSKPPKLGIYNLEVTLHLLPIDFKLDDSILSNSILFSSLSYYFFISIVCMS